MQIHPMETSGAMPLKDSPKRIKAIVENTLFRALIENSTDILVVANGQGEIVYSSPFIEKYFGVSSTEQMGKNSFEYINPEDLSRLAIIFFEVLENPGKPFFLETRAQTKDGTPIWVERTVTNLLATEGINGIVCNFRDTTERKNGEKKIMQAAIDAQEKEREEIGLELSIEDLVESIRRLEEGPAVSLDFSMPYEDILDDKLKTTIFRILQEQLNNVLKYAEASTIYISIQQSPDLLCMQVTDNGKGFYPEQKRTGIGISNIISRAEVFHGQVTIASSPGKGCCLTVNFTLGGDTGNRI